MAGGFDGMGVKKKESTHSVDNSYKYLINKDNFVMD